MKNVESLTSDHVATQAKSAEDGGFSRFPGGSLPVLTLPDGRVVTQSWAILRFVGGKAGLVPEDPIQQLSLDEAAGVCGDIMDKAPQDSDKAALKPKREEFAQGRLKMYMKHLQQMVTSSDGPFLLGGKISVGDLIIHGLVGMVLSGNFDFVEPSYMDQFPTLVALSEAVAKDPVVIAAGDFAK